MSIYIDLKAIHAEVAAAHPENSLYCLADHAGMPGLLCELERGGVSWASLFEGSREENALQVAPLLFVLDDEARKEHSYFLQWLAEHGTYTSSMLLLSSRLSLPELNRRLAQRLKARVSEEMNVLMRYFDPRTFEGLLTVLDEVQRDSFFSVADCWWYLDRSGSAVQLTARYASSDNFEDPLVLTAQQEFALLAASEPDQVADHLLKMMPEQWLHFPLPKRHEFIARHMAAAHQMGIVATHELSLYCGLVLLYGEGFALTSPWRDVLERVRLSEASLSDAIAEEGNVENAA